MKVWDENWSRPIVSFGNVSQRVNCWVPHVGCEYNYGDNFTSYYETYWNEPNVGWRYEKLYFESSAYDPDGGDISHFEYRIERSCDGDGGDFSSICNAWSKTHYNNSDANLDGFYDGRYRVKVKAYDSDGDWSEWSNWSIWYYFNVTRSPDYDLDMDNYIELHEGEDVEFDSWAEDYEDHYYDDYNGISEYVWYLDYEYDTVFNSSSCLLYTSDAADE